MGPAPEAELEADEPSSWRLAARALRSRNYRLFFSGQTVSLIGTWMSRLATSWLVYRLTDSAVLLGMNGFASQIPAFFLAPVAGVWIDRMDRHRALIVTQVLSMLQSLAMAVLIYGGWINIWWILSLSLFQGIINAFDMPIRQSFLVEMIEDRADLSNAIALNSSMVNGARLIGPAIAGAVIAAVGEGACFLIDGISYIAVIASLVAMRLPAREVRVSKNAVLAELAEGWRYVTTSIPIRAILLLLGLGSLIGMPFSVLMPIMAGKVLQGGPHTLGLLMGASGVGALISAISLALRRTVVGLAKRTAYASALFGLGLILFGVSRSLPLSMLVVAIAGYGMMQQLAASNTILQTIVTDDKRGRVMSFYTLAVFGITPFGSLLAGSLADRIGAPATLIGCGIAGLLGAFLFATKLSVIRREIRPIYVRLGILPELADR